MNDVLVLYAGRDLNLILAVTKKNQPSMEEELKRRGIQRTGKDLGKRKKGFREDSKDARPL